MAVPRTAFAMAVLCAAVAAPSPAGVLDPPGPPGPTMKTLAEIPPTWSLLLDATNGGPDGCNSTRFTCVLGTSAVLDHETGLVWARTPVNLFGSGWADSRLSCVEATIGGRGGWRLPAVTELTSLLVDLPPDAPFLLLPATVPYWSMTAVAGQRTRAWAVTTTGQAETRPKSHTLFLWCVRGPGPMSLY
jgi:hypothetical protein